MQTGTHKEGKKGGGGSWRGGGGRIYESIEAREREDEDGQAQAGGRKSRDREGRGQTRDRQKPPAKLVLQKTPPCTPVGRGINVGHSDCGVSR